MQVGGLREYVRALVARLTGVHLIAIRDAAVVFPPRILLRVAEAVRTGDMVMAANHGASEAGKVLCSHVSTCANEAVCLLMIDSLDLETLM